MKVRVRFNNLARKLSRTLYESAGLTTLLVILLAIPGRAAAFDKNGPVSLTGIVRETMAVYFSRKPDQPLSLGDIAKRQMPDRRFRKPAGVFVTLSHNGKSRACWGTVFPEDRDVVQATIHATLGALTKEYRYPPIGVGEWKSLKPQVTLVRGLTPIRSLSGVNPLRDGLMVRAGSKSGVILPGEAKDSYYQLVQCKLKAGIQPGEAFQMYRIKADVFQ